MTDISKVSLNEQTARIVRELAEAADLGRVKCWSSEPAPVKWLDAESVRAALLKRRALLQGIAAVQAEFGFAVAYQCCEHLNRALVMERERSSGWA